ncbi:MAG: dCTP deaminase [Candidatus Poribacteria bacterium]|nr:dCTP deaminase [Candidatus Poribacteria bacterium]
MILSDVDIKRYIREEKIKITPEPDSDTQWGSCSIDFRLGNIFRVFEHSKYPFIDLKTKVDADDLMRKVEVSDGEGFTMQPGEFVLAATHEKLELADDVMARLEGRSSLGRLGIIVHSTAGLFDPGWVGNATLELGNLGRMPVKLYPGMRICAFTFEQLSSPSSTPYSLKPSNKYAGQDGPETSRFAEDVELKQKNES